MLSSREIIISIFLFIVAGLLEVGGGWFVWRTLREDKPWWWALIGSALLVGYGIVPCFQPDNETELDASQFARIYAVYGGYFIVLALAWGWILDKRKPDTGDVIGACIAIVGALVIFFWPRPKASAV